MRAVPPRRGQKEMTLKLLSRAVGLLEVYHSVFLCVSVGVNARYKLAGGDNSRSPGERLERPTLFSAPRKAWENGMTAAPLASV